MLKNYFLIILIIPIVCAPSFSQEDVLRPKGKPGGYDPYYEPVPVAIGINAGINYNLFSQDLTWTPNLTNSPNKAFESGAGFSALASIFADVGLTDNLGLQFHLSYNGVRFGNKETGTIDCIIDGDPDNIRDAEAEVDYTVTGSMAGAALWLRYNIDENLFITFGPHFLFSNDDFEQEQSYSSLDSDCTFTDPETGGQVSVLSSTDGVSVNDIFGIDFGIGYKIPVTPKLYIIPKGNFQFNTTNIAEDLNGVDGTRIYTNNVASDLEYSSRMLHSISFTIGLWYDL